MFQSPHKRVSGDDQNQNSEEARSSSGGDLSFRADYYGGDFVEDGSFLVLSTDTLSMSPSTPPATADGDDKMMDMEVVNEVDENEEDEQQASSSGSRETTTSLSKSQVLGEDVESSVDSSISGNKQEAGGNDKGSLTSQLETLTSVMTHMTTTSTSSVASVSTDTHLMETGEEVNLLVAENKKLTELLADSNEKMKQCITTTEKLKSDHEDYKKKHEASRDIINQLRQDNDMLRSQVSMIQSRVEETPTQSVDKHDSLQRQAHTISELNDRLKTVLTVNGQLNDQLLGSQKAQEELQAEVTALMAEKSETDMKLNAMISEIESGRQAIAKFKEHQVKNQNLLDSTRTLVHNLEAAVEEKTKLVESLRRNMEDTVTSLERCNYKLNQKEQENSLLTTKLAAINAETPVFERLQVVEMQCHTYRSDYEKMREERAKLAAERDAILIELNAVNQQLKSTTDTLDNLRRQSVGEQRESFPVFEREPTFPSTRNDNSAAANANEPLPSPLTSLPTVAGQLVGFVRRELLGWEDQATVPGEANPPSSTEPTAVASGGTSEPVVQQPKQETIQPCPICRRKFSSLERLQTHASSCGIEGDDNPEDPFVFP